MSGLEAKGGDGAPVAWTRPERLAVAALLAVLLSGTGWLAWERLGTGTAGAPAGLVRADAAPSSGGLPAYGAGAAQHGGTGTNAGGDEASASVGSGGETFKTMRIHVAGAVQNPGVYALPQGSRVVDAVAAAGGRRSDGREDVLNLAAPLADGDKVYVPDAAEVARAQAGQSRAGSGGQAGADEGTGPAGGWLGAGEPGGGSAGGAGGRVDVNRADVRALDALPGVGPSLAAAIVRYRQEHGAFRSLAELEKVPGIGPAKLAAIRDLVVFR